MRTDEAPELAGHDEDFHGLRVDDLMTREVLVDGERLGWMAVIILENPSSRYDPCLPWMLGLRPTREEARLAAVALLEGLLEGRRRAMTDHPGIEEPDDAARRAMCEALRDARHEWLERRLPDAPTGGYEGARQQRRDLPAGVPTELVEWGRLVAATRKGWGWTQKEVAEKIDLDPPRLSRIERGKWIAPDDIITKLCDLLDLNAPVRSDG